MRETVAVKTRVGNLTFDAVIKVDHTSKLTMTTHPVEGGANITDHAYMEPHELSLDIGMSDVTSGGGQSVSVYAALRQLQESREPITVVTRLRTYHNMLIESITVPDDFTTMFGLRATIFLREIIIANTELVHVAARDRHKVGSTNGGTKQPNQSVLKQAADKLGI